MKISKNLKHIFIVASITFFLIIGVMRLFGPTFSTPITQFFVYRENVPFLNWLYRYHFEPSKDIVIVKIDEKTLNTFQSDERFGMRATKQNLKMFTIPKSKYMELIQKLEDSGVQGVAFDILFQNSDADEKEFSQKLTQYSNVVIASNNHNWKMENDIDVSRKILCLTDTGTLLNIEYYMNCEGLPRSVYANVTWGNIGFGDAIHKRIMSGIYANPYMLSGANMSTEVDTLPLALYKKTNSGYISPFPYNYEILTPFFGPAGSYHAISFSDVLKLSRVDLITTFGGKYVFIGESGTFIQDSHISPVTGLNMDGVETHAHVLDGILQQRYMQSFSITDFSYICTTLILVIFSVAVYFFSARYVAFIVVVFSLIVTLFLCRYFYFQQALVIEIFPLLLSTSIFSFPITYIYRFFIVDREKRLLTSAFAHYVDPEVVHEISERAEDISLGGESRELSVLFSDIAGFTTISEKLKPTDLFYLMSSYLSRMTDILTREGGTLDKYIGDAVMGFFGAPLTQYDHAIRACATALEMRDVLPTFNTELESRGIEPIDFRVGIASGDVLVGNIGSHDRFNYTVLGDTVNLASRLEATSKEYGTHIIVSEGTYLLARDHYTFRKLDLITVKGKNEPVGIYELIAKKSDNTINKALYERYEKALDLYMQADYLSAGKLWETQIDIDPPSRAMAHRCLDILKGDITIVDGVYHMTKK